MPLSVYRVNYFTPAIEEQLVSIYREWPNFNMQALKQGQLYVAEFNQRLLGAALLCENEVGFLSVRSVTRGREVGSELVHYIENIVAQSFDDVIVNTQNFPKAASFFEKLGYEAHDVHWMKKSLLSDESELKA